MRLLLDTHVVLWQLDGRPLSAAAEEAIDAADELFLSVVSFAEVGVKVATGKLAPREDLRELALAGGLKILPLSPEHGLGVGNLPLHHRDPFDRLLVAQALHERLTVLTADPRFTRYGLELVAA